MSAMNYPVAYRGSRAAATALGIGMGGLRGAGGGLPGFAAGAALTALVMAWMLSKERINSLRKLSAPEDVAGRLGDNWTTAGGAAGINTRGWTFVKEGYHQHGTGPFVALVNHNPTHPVYYQQTGFVDQYRYEDLTVLDADTKDLHVLGGLWGVPPQYRDTYTLYHKDAGVRVTGRPVRRVLPLTTTMSIPQKGDHHEAGYGVPPFVVVSGDPHSGADTRSRGQTANPPGKLWIGYGRKPIPIVTSPPVPRAIPKENVREAKLHITMFGQPPGVEFIASLFEVLDMIDAICAGLPGCIKYWDTLEKLDYILKNWDKINWRTVGKAVEDQLEDYAYGIQGKALAGMSRAAGMPIGLGRTFGPVLGP